MYTPPHAYSLRLRDLWHHRALIRYFGKLYVKRKYRRTWLGWLWVPLRPTYDLVGRSILFGGLLAVSSGNRPYFVFFIVGTSAWCVVQIGLMQTTRALDINRALFARLNLPRSAALLAALVPAAVDILMYAVIGFGGCLFYKLTRGSFYIHISLQGLAGAAIGASLLALWVLALGCWLSPLAYHARDARYLLGYAVAFWFMITPIIYPISSIPSHKLQVIAKYNPLTGPVQLVQWGLLQTSFPEMISLVVSVVTLAIVGVGGLLFLARFESRAAATV